MKANIHYLLLIIMFGACSEHHDFVFFQKENGILFKEKLTLVEKDTISFPLDDQSAFWHFSIGFNSDHQKKESYFSFYNHFDHSIKYYNLKNRILNTIPLKINGVNGLGNLHESSAHLFINPDSVYVYNPSSGKLFNVNRDGRINTKVDVYKKGEMPFPEPSTKTPMLIVNDEIYFTCGLQRSRLNYRNYGIVLKHNLKTDEQKYILPFPELYNKAFWGSSFRYHTNFSFNERTQRLVLNYPIHSFIYQADLNGNIVDSTYVGSKYFQKVKPMYADLSYALKSNRDFSREDQFSLSNSDYPMIMYDSHQNIYYRIAYIRPILEEVKKGNRVTDFSIIILDEHFNKIGEKKFSSAVYDNSMIAVIDMGIVIARKDLYEKNNDILTFSVFNVKKI